ncbi:MAG: 23S rRNA (guanosine(2251)-2'-O)-methyltransferase RlmB [Clostridiales bacterium]|jgi:23S rRNA (guanosine2251-2'-O)-methyltransferase|nr:23S rRNA (guanosine(2251)-2'-O)-methyltransferase RlmB [Clostridiales bacterium]
MKHKNMHKHEKVEDENLFEGRNAVLELLNAEKTIHRLFIKDGEAQGSLKVIFAKAKERGIPVTFCPKDKLDKMSETGKHQGVIALCPPFEYASLTQVLRDCAAKSEEPFLIILDKIFDPHNFGAIIRTAMAAGAHGVIIPKRRSVGITSAVVRASAGAAGHLPIIRVSNISQAMDAMKKSGIWMVGAETDGEIIYDAPLSGPIALIIGNESEGLSRLVKEKCDFLVSIPMIGSLASLNASVAAGVAMYEVVRRRMYGLR